MKNDTELLFRGRQALAIIVIGLIGLAIIRKDIDLPHLHVECRPLGPTTTTMQKASGGLMVNASARPVTFDSKAGSLILSEASASFIPISVRNLTIPIEYIE